MSQRIITAVFEKHVSARKPAHLVALYLAFLANDEGTDIRVSTDEIAAKARISLRTAKEIVAEMLANDWLRLEVAGIGGAPTLYAINPAWVAANAR